MSRFALVGIAVLIATTLAAQQSDESFEVEPPLLRQNLRNESASTSNATPEPILDLARLEKDLERARKNAAGAERLYKMGALAKVEAEARALKVVRLEADLENARLVRAKEEALNRQNRPDPGEVAETSASKVEIDLSHAIQAAQQALWQTLRIVAEPGGAAAFAALLWGQYKPATGEQVGVLLCGANTTAVDFDRPVT